MAFAACGDGNRTSETSPTVRPTDSPAAPTAIPTSATSSAAAPTTTAAVSGCPVDSEVCDFGREIERFLAAGQYDAVVDRTRSSDITCPGPKPEGAGGPFPLCAGAAQGERREGYATGALQSEGAVESRDGLIDLMRGWVDRGRSTTPVHGTGPALATVGCPLMGTAPDCSNRFAIVFVRGDGTSLLRFGVQRSDAVGAPPAQITQTVVGLIVVNAVMVSGGDDSLPVLFGVDEHVGTRYFIVD